MSQHFIIRASLGTTLLWAGHCLDVRHLLLVEEAGHQVTALRREAEESTLVHLPALSLAVLPLTNGTTIKTNVYEQEQDLTRTWCIPHVQGEHSQRQPSVIKSSPVGYPELFPVGIVLCFLILSNSFNKTRVQGPPGLVSIDLKSVL